MKRQLVFAILLATWCADANADARVVHVTKASQAAQGITQFTFASRHYNGPTALCHLTVSCKTNQTYKLKLEFVDSRVTSSEGFFPIALPEAATNGTIDLKFELPEDLIPRVVLALSVKSETNATEELVYAIWAESYYDDMKAQMKKDWEDLLKRLKEKQSLRQTAEPPPPN